MNSKYARQSVRSQILLLTIYLTIVFDHSQFAFKAKRTSQFSTKKNRVTKMDFFDSIRVSMRVCQLICLSPFSLKTHQNDSSTSNSVRKVFAFVIILVQFLVVIFSIVFNPMIVNPKLSRTIRTFDCAVLTLIQLNALVIFIESYAKRSTEIDFLQKINTIDFILEFKIGIHLNYVEQQFCHIKRLVRWLVIDVTVFIVNVTIFYNFSPENMYMWWTILFLSFSVCSIRYCQMVSYVYLIQYRYFRINEFIDKFDLFGQNIDVFNIDLATAIQSLNDNSHYDGRIYNYTSKVVYQKLVDLRRVYRLISSASQNINHMFQWSISSNITNDVLHILINSYWILRLLIEGYKGIAYMIIPGLWTLVNINHLISLSSLCHHASSEVKQL